MIKNECEIIRDLFPNYMEKLISNETREFIDSHMINCEQCRELLDTIQEGKVKEHENNKTEDEQEIHFLKKYRTKMILLRNTLLFIIGVLITVILIYAIKYGNNNRIISKSYENINSLYTLNNYSINIKEHQINYKTNRESIYDTTYYYKDGKYKERYKMELVNEQLHNADYTYYGNVNSNKRVEIFDESKLVVNRSSNSNFVTNGHYFDEYRDINFLGNELQLGEGIIIKSGIHSRTEKYEEKDCYVLKFQNNKESYREIWIEKESMLPIRKIEYIEDVSYIERIISLEINGVTDTDIEIPQIDGYTIKDIEETLNDELLRVKNN